MSVTPADPPIPGAVAGDSINPSTSVEIPNPAAETMQEAGSTSTSSSDADAWPPPMSRYVALSGLLGLLFSVPSKMEKRIKMSKGHNKLKMVRVPSQSRIGGSESRCKNLFKGSRLMIWWIGSVLMPIILVLTFIMGEVPDIRGQRAAVNNLVSVFGIVFIFFGFVIAIPLISKALTSSLTHELLSSVLVPPYRNPSPPVPTKKVKDRLFKELNKTVRKHLITAMILSITVGTMLIVFLLVPIIGSPLIVFRIVSILLMVLTFLVIQSSATSVIMFVLHLCLFKKIVKRYLNSIVSGHLSLDEALCGHVFIGRLLSDIKAAWGDSITSICFGFLLGLGFNIMSLLTNFETSGTFTAIVAGSFVVALASILVVSASVSAVCSDIPSSISNLLVTAKLRQPSDIVMLANMSRSSINASQRVDFAAMQRALHRDDDTDSIASDVPSLTRDRLSMLSMFSESGRGMEETECSLLLAYAQAQAGDMHFSIGQVKITKQFIGQLAYACIAFLGVMSRSFV